MKTFLQEIRELLHTLDLKLLIVGSVSLNKAVGVVGEVGNWMSMIYQMLSVLAWANISLPYLKSVLVWF